MDLDREAWAWGRKMKPKFDAAEQDFNSGIKTGLLYCIPAIILTLLVIIWA
jgi:hypothetical protein